MRNRHDFWKNIEVLKERYDIPREAILKSDLLRCGLSFSKEALQKNGKAKEKSYFIFSFDRVAQKDLSSLERHLVPEEIALMGGPLDLQRTIVSSRVNPSSPYQIEYENEGYILQYKQEKICNILLPKRPTYYQKNLSNGKPVSDITPTIEWGYLIYITAFRLCQYWGTEEECAFCDINENYRQQKKERSYTAVKNIEEIIESLKIIEIYDTEKSSKAYTVTGGSITKEFQGDTEAAFYAKYARAIEKEFPNRWMGKAVVQALPAEEVKILKEAGYQIYHPNFEVWDKNLFQKLCPGKEKYIGRDAWIRRIIDAAEIFGASHVIPNFVAGIEMSKPHGFQTMQKSISSTAEGLNFFMSQGIVPRFTVWCVEPNTTLSQMNNDPPPLEYFVRLLQIYRETHRKYRLPIPPGYGPAGVGQAVFSVSAFMDVL